MKQMPIHVRRELAKKSGIGDDYLYQILTGRKKASIPLCAVLERETNHEITCEDLRPDVDWAVLRGTPATQEPTHG